MMVHSTSHGLDQDTQQYSMSLDNCGEKLRYNQLNILYWNCNDRDVRCEIIIKYDNEYINYHP